LSFYSISSTAASIAVNDLTVLGHWFRFANRGIFHGICRQLNN
jgi:hypothetical protein